MTWEYAKAVCEKSNLTSECSKNCDKCPVPLIVKRATEEFDRYLVRNIFGEEALSEFFEEE